MGSNYTERCTFLKTIYRYILKYSEDPVLARTGACMAALESNFGTSYMMKKAHAPFGIKATKGWTGKVYSSTTKEVYNGINCNITATFRAYGSIEEACADFVKVMKLKRYAAAWGTCSIHDCINAIKKAGYATDPLYVNKVLHINIKYNDVFYYDSSFYKIALDVIDGKYGNGEERKKALGENYQTIQSIVNNILSK